MTKFKNILKKVFKGLWITTKVVWVVAVTYAAFTSLGFGILHELRFQIIEKQVSIQQEIPATIGSNLY